MKKVKYDETQLKRHPRRTPEQNKAVKEMIYHLDLMLGEQHTGMFLAMICDCLNKLVLETPAQFLKLRTIEITFNDFYSVKFDCETEKYVK